jgi:hypothetical protein
MAPMEHETALRMVMVACRCEAHEASEYAIGASYGDVARDLRIAPETARRALQIVLRGWFERHPTFAPKGGV